MRHLFKVTFIFVLFFTLILTKPLSGDNYPLVIENVNERNTNGYYFKYKLSDGQSREETGTLNQIKGGDHFIIYVKGSYSYIDTNGRKYKVNYKADDTGYNWKINSGPSQVLPQPVAIPQAHPFPLPRPQPTPRPHSRPYALPKPYPSPKPYPVARPQPVPRPQPQPRPTPKPITCTVLECLTGRG